ncbi:MAG: hypothetical protein A2Y17_01890 [Clostridiales bacterium GWF2_38_85]|nr:MAG: hypothetical protein A2Y17_01890 [Clostridiales bacterium GWF2_38_85]HBL84738.1 hypothetical protein [Clostridiales bacterium]
MVNSICGDFIQAHLHINRSEAEWEAEIYRLKALGVEYIIIDTIGRTSEKQGGKWRVNYDSELPELTGDNCAISNPKLLDTTLAIFEKHGIKCFVNMGDYTDWWHMGGWGNSYIEHCEISAKAAVELYDKYKAKYPNAFHGFYWCIEFYNNIIYTAPFVKKLSKGMNIVVDAITSKDPTLPLLMSPFHTEYMLATSLRGAERFWNGMFKNIHFRKGDIFCPQDAVGAGWTRLKNLEAVTKMYKRVVENCGKGLRFWSNCENFTQCHTGKFLLPKKTENTVFITSTLDRFITQIETVSPYVEKIISFSLSHYYSAVVGYEDYYNALLHYLKTGNRPTDSPVWVTKGIKDAESKQISWQMPETSHGVAYFRITKNNSFLLRIDRNENKINCELSDSLMQPENYYEITAVDVWGNKSEALKI